MDSVFIRQLELHTVIGVYDWEKSIRQRVLIDLDLFIDVQAAATNDELAKTIDYRALSDRLLAFAESSQCDLIETLANAIADIVMLEFKPTGLILWVHKPDAVQQAQTVGIRLRRGQVERRGGPR